MDQTVKERESGPDLVRTLACFFVIAVHFYLNVGYYNAPLEGMAMVSMTAFRWLFVTAVPLFFMLTGYFKKNKVMDKVHYRALVPLFISYVVISVGKMLLYNRLFGKIYGVREMLENLGNYQIAWYMGMYLCLFLLIPFLNKGWYAMTQKEQNVLLVTLIGLCTVYPVFKYIAPSYFTGIYPVVFYFLGVAVADRKPRPGRWYLLLMLIAVVILETVITVKCTSTGNFDWNVISTPDDIYGTFFITACTVCIFLLLYDVRIKNGFIRSALSSVSSVSFEIYLFSGAYDALIYAYAGRYYTEPSEAFWIFFITVPLSFICAYLSSLVFRRVVFAILKISGFPVKS